MATISFNQLDDLLNGKRAQDSLAQGAQGVQSNPELPGYSGRQGGDTAGFAGGGGGGQKFQSGPKAKDPMAIIEANKGAQALNLASETTKNVQEATKGLQSQADSYVSKMGGTDTKPLERSVLDDLFSGGARAGEAAGRVRSRLDEGFKADDLNLDTKEAWDAQAFSDPSKLKALRRETGNRQFQGGYTSGMQALDEAVERRTPQDYGNVLRASQDFRSTAEKAAERGKTAKGAAEERFNKETAGIREALKGQAGKVESELASRLQNQSAADAKETERLRKAAILEERKSAGVDDLKKRVGEFRNLKTPVSEGYQGDVSPVEAELAALERDIDAGKYVTTSSPTRTRDDVATAENRMAFNLINELLGTGQRLGQGMAAAPTVATQDVRTPAQKISAALDSLFKSRADAAAAFEAQRARNAAPKATAAPIAGEVRAPLDRVAAPPATTSAPQYDTLNWGGGLGGIASNEELAQLESGKPWAPPSESVAAVPTVRGEPGLVPTSGPGTANPRGTEAGPLSAVSGKMQ